ncbi:MAG TPA: hypothetical protein DDY92_03050 [Dialister sp.]|nr:hypothetical protein [Dialister sp.]
MKIDTRFCLYSLLIVICAIIIGTVSLIFVYALPSSRTMYNAQKSIDIYQREGAYPSWAPGKASAGLDNFTDAIMIENAIFPGSGHLVEDAMLNPRYAYPKKNPTDSLIKELQGETQDRTIIHYARYWHGYLLYLKPLLTLRPVKDIRLLNGTLQIILAFYLFSLIARKLDYKYGWAFLCSYITLNPISLAMSFQYSSMYYIMMLGSIYLLKKWNKSWLSNKYIYFFIVIGTVTAFFDFLTYPLISYGIPMALLLILANQGNCLCQKFDGIVISIKGGIAWGFGYCGMYMGKWIISWLLTGYNTFLEASRQASYRMSISTVGGEGNVSFHAWNVIVKNLAVLAKDPIFIFSMILCFLCLYLILKKKGTITNKSNISLQYALGLVSISPLVWYSVLTNHSYVHSWFTFRELSIFIFSIGCLLVSKLLEKENDSRNIEYYRENK